MDAELIQPAPRVFPVSGNVTVWMLGLSLATGAIAEPRPIDISQSTVTVQVKKAGLFSAFAHDHEISAPLAAGTVDTAGRTVEVRFEAAALQVRDPGVADKERAEIQGTMLGSGVLDAKQYPEIVFRSTRAEPVGAGAWRVQGDLMLHGRTRPVTAEVRENGGRYAGTLRLRQSDFGITPIKIAGGAVRVKDEVEIEFDLQLGH